MVIKDLSSKARNFIWISFGRMKEKLFESERYFGSTTGRIVGSDNGCGRGGSWWKGGSWIGCMV